MIYFFVCYCFRKHSEAPVDFANSVCATETHDFPFISIAQKIADDHNMASVTIVNWKEMTQLEYLDYKRSMNKQERDVSN